MSGGSQKAKQAVGKPMSPNTTDPLSARDLLVLARYLLERPVTGPLLPVPERDGTYSYIATADVRKVLDWLDSMDKFQRGELPTPEAKP